MSLVIECPLVFAIDISMSMLVGQKCGFLFLYVFAVYMLHVSCLHNYFDAMEA